MTSGANLSASVEVPGKIMLAGEYAVLKGLPALACTVNAKLKVKVQLHKDAQPSDDKFVIHSNLWTDPAVIYRDQKMLPENKGGEKSRHYYLLDNVADPLVGTVQHCLRKFGFSAGQLHVESELNTKYGIGSSSAVRLGTILALAQIFTRENFRHHHPKRWELVKEGFELQKSSQGHASGYDLITQNMGGLVRTRCVDDQVMSWPGIVERYRHLTPHVRKWVHPYIGGAGAPTTPVLQDTMQWLNQQELWPALGKISDKLVDDFVLLFSAEDASAPAAFKTLLKSLAAWRDLFWHSPHFPVSLFEKLSDLPGFNTRWSAKTTGAGGEDALILIGEEEHIQGAHNLLYEYGWQPLPYDFSYQPTQIFQKDTLQ